jgi:LPPG:FO 2-phospho-L-lactate transferase
MMRELGIEVSAAAVARRYRDLIDAYVVDHADAADAAALDAKVVAASALMVTLADREALARAALTAADGLMDVR